MDFIHILTEVSKCKKCGKVIAEPKELIRIKKYRNILSISVELPKGEL